MPRRKVAPKERPSRPKSCIVCGAAASGYNYGAPSCLSCKAFFRRTVIKQDQFEGCSRYGLCSSKAGVPCRSCRYHRCIIGGMKEELVTCGENAKPTSSRVPSIVDPTEDTEECRYSEILEWSCSADNRYGLPSLPSSQSSFVSPTTSPYCTEDQPTFTENMIISNPVLIENQMEKIMQSLLSLEAAHQQMRISKYCPELFSELSINDFLPGPSKLGEKFEPMNSFAPMALSIPPMEMIINNRTVVELPNFDYNKMKLWPFQDVVYSIQFIKALAIFQFMEDDSKRTLIASALLCADFTTAYYSYSHNYDRTCYPDGSVISWSSEIQQLSPYSTRFHTALIASMREVDLDIREYLLLKLIIIFNPMLDGLHPYDASLIQGERERMAKSLLSYVLSRRGVEKGPTYYSRILSIVEVATKLNSWQKSQHILAIAMGLYRSPAAFVESIYHSH